VAEETDSSDDLNVFLRWEQLAAYARGGGNNDWYSVAPSVQKRTGTRLTASGLVSTLAQFILSDQKDLRALGLYSVPSRSSGLVEGSPTRLTAEGRQFVEENYLPVLDGKGEDTRGSPGRSSRESVRLSSEPKDRDRVLFDAVANALRRKFSAAERSLYVRHLIEGGPTDSTHGGQRVLADAMRNDV